MIEEKIITILKHRGCSVQLGGFMTNDEHGNFSVVFTLTPHLLGLEVIEIQSADSPPPQNAPSLVLWSRKVIASNGTGRVEARHIDEEMRLGFSADDYCRSNEVWRKAS